MKINASPAVIKKMARESWNAMKPNDNFDVKEKYTPEITRKHEQFVRAYLENDFDPVRVVKVMLGGKNGFFDLSDDSQEFQMRLVEVLKVLARVHCKRM